MCSEIKKVQRLINIGVRKFYYIGDEIISESEQKETVEYIANNGLQKVYSRMEDLCRQYNTKNTGRCSWLLFHLDDGMIYDCSDFSETIYVPFEFTEISVPKEYDKILKRRYGDYMKPVKGGALHGSLIVSTTIPYDKYDLSQVENSQKE
jgi:phosphorylcholine metabolism protein LicD